MINSRSKSIRSHHNSNPSDCLTLFASLSLRYFILYFQSYGIWVIHSIYSIHSHCKYSYFITCGCCLVYSLYISLHTLCDYGVADHVLLCSETASVAVREWYLASRPVMASWTEKKTSMWSIYPFPIEKWLWFCDFYPLKSDCDFVISAHWKATEIYVFVLMWFTVQIWRCELVWDRVEVAICGEVRDRVEKDEVQGLWMCHFPIGKW